MRDIGQEILEGIREIKHGNATVTRGKIKATVELRPWVGMVSRTGLIGQGIAWLLLKALPTVAYIKTGKPRVE